MGWSVYTNIIARGAEVQFDRNAMLEIRFNERQKETAKAKAKGN